MVSGSETLELKQNGSYNDVDSVTLSFGSGNSRRKKYIIAAAVLVGVAVLALVVGLAVGLRESNNDNDNDQQPALGGNASVSSTTSPQYSTPLPPYQPVLLISLDGFRASYLSYNVTPHIRTLIREGVHTPRMLSAYPTLTFPNHYTIVTGLYPESHGIVDNKMYDISFQRLYVLGSLEASKPKWYGGEPIWLTVQRQGKRSACYFWVGSDVAIDGEYPNEYRRYNGSVPFSERVDTVLDWLSQPADQRPDLITLYFNEPDHTGHAEGPGPTPEMLNALQRVDAVIGQLISGLQHRNLYDDVNVIVVSDHGMAARSCHRQVKLKDHFNSTELDNMYVYTSAAGRISNRYRGTSRLVMPLDSPRLSTEEILRRLSDQAHLAAYDKRHLPRRLHYANNIRIDDVILKMDDQWVVSKEGSSGSSCSGGTHGWDSRYESMAALFVARGPSFKEGVEVPPFENIELYHLMADLLKLTAAPNNGTRGSLHNVLKNPPPLEKLKKDEIQCQQSEKMPSSVLELQTHCNCSSSQSKVLVFQPQGEDTLHPVWSTSQSTLCLSAPDHKTVYSMQLHMPLWTSFTITNKEDITQDSKSCFISDNSLPLVEQEVFRMFTNKTLNATTAALFSSSSSCGLITRSSDGLPMTENLKEGLWQEVWSMLRSVTNSSYPAVSVTVGPVFDYDYNGLADDVTNITRHTDSEGKIPLPSHYFVVLGRCPHTGQNLLQCINNLDLLSFVLPNEQNQNGQTAERRLLENVARLRDVELLTGLQFFPGLDPALSARLRTHVPTSLWSKPGLWTDDLESRCSSSYQPVLLISLDGFRADYLVKYNRTPTIDRLISKGVHAPYMRSAYPTKTFPNHYTIVTGLYPESHGIIDNNMYDFNISQKFCMSCTEAKNPAWWGGEPIWLTAQRQGLTTATYFWPGSDVPIQGTYPDYYKTYDGAVPYEERVTTVLQWLKLPANKRPDFITLYFDEPDHTGHQVGPDSPQIGEKLMEVDNTINQLMQGLYQQDMHRCVNIIIIADHGMSSISCDRLVPLSADISYADLGKMYVYDGPVGRISNKYKYGRTNNSPLNPPSITIDTIVDKLECSDVHMRVYTKPSLPLRHHYTNNQRIDDVILDADDQWLISRAGSTRYCTGGNHGYDNLYASMHALFLAFGPAFRSGVEIEPFENIELYNLMADLLNVTAAPNNGTEGMLFDVLRTPPLSQTLPSIRSTESCRNKTSTSLAQAKQAACSCSRAAASSVSDWRSPLGEPVASPGGPRICETHRSDHSLAYDSDMLAPAWIAFNVNVTNATSSMRSATPCVVDEPSVSTVNTSLFDSTGFVPASLLFGSDDPCNVAMASEIVPMLAEFKTGIWREVEHVVADYSVKYGEIAVTVGPVYNDDATALWQGRTNRTWLVKDTYPVPTHFFLVLGKCASAEQSLPCWDSLELMSFIIPHVATPTNCQSFSDMLRQNVARVRDIEVATGLQFFPDLPVSSSARLRTFLPTQVWTGSTVATHVPKPGNWTEQECPPKDHADRQCPNNYQPVLLVSLDGFKPQYLGRGLTPVIDRLISCGVHAPYMRSVYPTKTFPNHYSIATGLYPESHGIIDNNMFDFTIGNKKFKISSDTKNDPRWWGGEPIWVTAQKQNVTSASFFWVGSDVEILGTYPNLFKYYSGAVPYSSRVSTIVEWMRLPEQRRPEFLMLYFDEPDHQAHTSGPFTPEVDAQIQRVDGVLGELMDSLYQHDLHHCVNLMLVSDHGFSSMSCDQVVELNDYFDQSEKNELYFYFGPFARISNTYRRLRNGTTIVYNGSPPMSVKDVQDHLRCVDHMKVYAKTDLPKRHHYVNNKRIDNIILDPAINWTVSDQVNPRYCSGGSHGWDNTYKAMEALFVGYGPAFKNGEAVKAFENIELYNMISDLLEIEPASNNGTEGSLDHLLWRTFNRTRSAASAYSKTAVNTNIAVTATCNCTLSFNQSSDTISHVLNSQNVSVTKQHALPFGTPLLMTPNVTDVTLLIQPTHVTAYSSDWSLPVWVSASVSPSALRDTVNTARCAVEDTRLSNQPQCENLQLLPENVTYTSLLPLAYDMGVTAALLSSQIPMHQAFSTGVWQTLQIYLGNWSLGYQDLNVMAGPAFDVNSDGLADMMSGHNGLNTSIPTHVFVIAARCEDNSQPLAQCSSVQTLTFILPQVDTSQDFNCQTMSDYLVDNEARVRDVELLTGLHFFPNLPFRQAVAMRTFLPSGLWPL